MFARITSSGSEKRSMDPPNSPVIPLTSPTSKAQLGATKELETDERIDKMDSRLAHLIEAKQSIKARWQKQRSNRRLRKKIAELNRQIEAHCKMLCTQQWNEACNEGDGQIHKGKTWNMLRHLLDDTKTKGHQNNNLARILHRAICEHGEDKEAKVAAFHIWRPSERKTYKAALGLLGSTSTENFVALGVHNTLDEIAEAQRTAQLERLTETRTGRQILRDLGLEPREGKQQTNVPIPDSINRKLRVCPIPRNVNPEHNKERRLARAKASWTSTPEKKAPSTWTRRSIEGAATHTRRWSSGHRRVQRRPRRASGLEKHTGRKRTAVKNYAKGRVCSEAARILRKAEDIGRKKAVVIRWFLAHMGSDVSERGNANHNETANAAARGLTNRAAANTADLECWSWCSAKDKMTSFNEIVKWKLPDVRLKPRLEQLVGSGWDRTMRHRATSVASSQGLLQAHLFRPAIVPPAIRGFPGPGGAVKNGTFGNLLPSFNAAETSPKTSPDVFRTDAHLSKAAQNVSQRVRDVNGTCVCVRVGSCAPEGERGLA
ncbi:hypothetical protein HPB47_008173 [Ixodes persulcatus]|uniref:Uncharacterized protein n=1 Tax=Ixodes persulcatus TaxID=34615 RepID=A0AC60P5S0_IXOPE|nr:hypothetical protein HPB47_008173 [Ixodes persulcatus]